MNLFTLFLTLLPLSHDFMIPRIPAFVVLLLDSVQVKSEGNSMLDGIKTLFSGKDRAQSYGHVKNNKNALLQTVRSKNSSRLTPDEDVLSKYDDDRAVYDDEEEDPLSKYDDDRAVYDDEEEDSVDSRNSF